MKDGCYWVVMPSYQNRGYTICFLFSFFLFIQNAAAQKPAITSFAPAAGPVGTSVIITGSNFSPVVTNNAVFFGDVKGVVTAATASTLTVVVPAGASYKLLSVISNGLVGYAAKPFLPTFPGGSSYFAVQSFMTRLDSLVGAHPSELEACDFDGDGRPDLVMTNNVNSQITILKNSSQLGAIAFSQKLNFTTGSNPFALATGDLDGDTKPDLVVVRRSSNLVSVFKNGSVVGALAFLPQLDLAAGSLPAYCAIGDVDGDGRPDIVCTNSGANSLSVFRNTGSGGNLSFASKTDYPVGDEPAGIALADMDGDGVQEIAVANRNGSSVSIFKNRSTVGTILLDSRTEFTNSYQPTKLFAADMDGDGKPELIAGSNNASAFSVMRNKSVAGVVQMEAALPFSTGIGASHNISLGDANGDGKVDVAANHYLYAQVSLVKNESVPDTLRFASRVDYTASSMTSAALLSDWDVDGKPDLTTANHTAASVSIFKNVVTKPYVTSFSPTTAGERARVEINGNNFSGAVSVRFGSTPAASFSIESNTKITAVVDTGSSGDVQVTTQYGSGRLAGFLFSRQPTIQNFTPTRGAGGTTITIQGTNFKNTSSVLIGNMVATSFVVVSPSIITATAPVLVAGNFDVQVTTPFGTAVKGSFYTGPVIQSFFPTSGSAGSIVTIIGSNFSPVAANNLVVFGTVKATVLSASPASLQVIVPTGTGYHPISVTVNELTVASIQPFSTTFRGTCNGFTSTSFVRRFDSSAGSFPNHASIADLNSDGRPDVIVSNGSSRFISVSRNTSMGGNPSFQLRKDFLTTEYPLSTSIGDFDGDGKPDIFLLTTQTGVSLQRTSVIFRNTSSGDSIFLTRSEHPLGILNENPERSAVADFNSDGKPDVAVLGSGTLSVLKNTSTVGAIGFAPKIDFYSVSLARSINITDVDGDGKVDIIVTNLSGDRLSILRNTSEHGQIMFAPVAYVQTGFSPSSVALGDFDGDGKPDMAVSTRGNNSVSIHKNTGTTGVISFGPRINFPLGAIPENLLINDLDGDGRLDVAVATGNSESISILRNVSTNGSLSFDNPFVYPKNYNFSRVFAADVTGDGKPDLLTTNGNGSNFSVYSNQCGDNSINTAAITAVTTTELCEGDSAVLKTTSISGATYQWYKDGIIVTTATDSVYSAKATGRYSVNVLVGSSVSSSAPVAVTKKSLPAVPQISGAGTGSFCQGTGLLLYSSAWAGNQWYRNNVPVANAVDSSLYVSEDGLYKVVVNHNGCLAASASVPVVIKQTPMVTVAASGQQLCSGDSLQLTATQNSGFNYQWNLNEEQLPGATAAQLFARKTGTYTVTVSANGCTSITQPLIITETLPPLKPTITISGNVLQSSSLTGNQWYRDGLAIPGATAQIYPPTSSGLYTVQVTQNGCTSIMSDGYPFVVTGMVTIDQSQFIRLSPNPVITELRLEYKLLGTSTVHLDLIDLSGRVMGSWFNVKSGSLLNLSNYATGTYLVRINRKNDRAGVVLKIIKL